MVVILEPEDFEGWLTGSVAQAKEKYCKQWNGELVGEPAPLPRRSRKPPPPAPKPADPTGTLF